MRNRLLLLLSFSFFSFLLFTQFSCSDSEAERKKFEEQQKKLIEQFYNKGLMDGLAKISNASQDALMKFQNVVIYTAIISGLVILFAPAISGYLNEYSSKIFHLSTEEKLNLSTGFYVTVLIGLWIWSWNLSSSIFVADLILCSFSLYPFILKLRPGIKENDKEKIKAGAAQIKSLLLISALLCLIYSSLSKSPYT